MFRRTGKYVVYEWTKYDDKLHQAVKKGDVAKVQSYLKKGVKPSKIDPTHGLSALHEAAASGNIEILQLMLSSGDVDVNIRDSQGLTLLHYAVRRGNTDIALKLLEARADPAAIDQNRLSALHHACSGNMDCVVLLLKFRVPVGPRDTTGKTPLLYAANNGQASICRLLLDNGADINTADSSGDTALIGASKKGSAQLCQFLINRGANLHDVNDKGKDALHYAIEKKYTDVRKVLEAALRGSRPPSEILQSQTSHEGRERSHSSSSTSSRSTLHEEHAEHHEAQTLQSRPSLPEDYFELPVDVGPGELVRGQASVEYDPYEQEMYRKLYAQKEYEQQQQQQQQQQQKLEAKVSEERHQTKRHSRSSSSSDSHHDDNESDNDDIIIPHHEVKKNNDLVYMKEQIPERIDNEYYLNASEIGKLGAAQPGERRHSISSDSSDDERKPGKDRVDAVGPPIDAVKIRDQPDLIIWDDQRLKELLRHPNRFQSQEELEYCIEGLVRDYHRLRAAGDPGEILKERDHLLRTLELEKQSHEAELRMKEHHLREFQEQLQRYDHLMFEKEGIERELLEARQLLLNSEAEKGRNQAEMEEFQRNRIHIEETLRRQNAIIAAKDKEMVEVNNSYQQTLSVSNSLSIELEKLKRWIASGNLGGGTTKQSSELERLRVEISAVRAELEKTSIENGQTVARAEQLQLKAAVPYNRRSSSSSSEHEGETAITMNKQQLEAENRKLNEELDRFRIYVATLGDGNSAEKTKQKRDLDDIRLEVGALRNELEMKSLLSPGITGRNENYAELQQAYHLCLAKNHELEQELQNAKTESVVTVSQQQKPLETTAPVQNIDKNILEALRLEIYTVRDEMEKNALRERVYVEKKEEAKIKSIPEEAVIIRETEKVLETVPVQQPNISQAAKDDGEMLRLRIEIAAVRDELERRVVSEVRKTAQHGQPLVRMGSLSSSDEETVQKKTVILGSAAPPVIKQEEVLIRNAPTDNAAKLLREMETMRLELYSVRDELERNLIRTSGSVVIRATQEKRLDAVPVQTERPASSISESDLKKLEEENFWLKKELEQFKAYMISQQKQNRSSQHFGNDLTALRMEIYEIRDELERAIVNRINTVVVMQEERLSTTPPAVVPIPKERGDSLSSSISSRSDVEQKIEISQIDGKLQAAPIPITSHARDDNELAQIRLEVHALRNELEMSIVRNFQERPVATATEKQAKSAVSAPIKPESDSSDDEVKFDKVVVTQKQQRPHSIQQYPIDERDEGVINLRREISALRDEMESNLLKKVPAVIKYQEPLKVTPVPARDDKELEVKAAENQALKTENARLSGELESLKAYILTLEVKEQQQPVRAVKEVRSDELTRLRLELTAVRDEMERNMLANESVIVPQQQQIKVSAAPLVKASNDYNTSSDEDEQTRKPDETGSDVNLLKAELARIRIEVASLREELERKHIQPGAIAKLEPKEVESKSTNVEQLKNENQQLNKELDDLRLYIRNYKPVTVSDDDAKKEMERMRVEMTSIRNELEQKVLEKGSETIIIQKESKVAAVPRKENSLDDDVDGKVEWKKETDVKPSGALHIQLRDELLKIRSEVTGLRCELEARTMEKTASLEEKPLVLVPVEKLQRPPSSSDDEKEIKNNIGILEAENDRLNNELNNLKIFIQNYKPPVASNDSGKREIERMRLELTAIRDELEKNVMERNVDIIKQEEVVVKRVPVEFQGSNIRTQSSSSEDLDEIERINKPKDTRIDDSYNLRSEILALREELEAKTIQNEPRVIVQKEVRVETAPKEESENLEKLQAENDRLSRELEELKVYIDHYKPEDKYKSELERIRAEMTAVRTELEKVTLENDSRVRQQEEKVVSSVPIKSAPLMDSDSDDDIMKTKENNFKAPNQDVFGELLRIRMEVAALRSELETKAMEPGRIVIKEREIKSDAKLEQIQRQRSLSISSTEEGPKSEVLTTPGISLEKLRMEIASLRAELESTRMEQSPSFSVASQETQKASPPRKISRDKGDWSSSSGDEDEVITPSGGSRLEAVPTSDEELKSFKIYVRNFKLQKDMEADQARREIEKLRCELMAVRTELEHNQLEKDTKERVQNVVPIQSVPVQKEHSRTTSDSSDEGFLSEEKKRLRDSDGLINKLRQEIAALRLEVEMKALLKDPSEYKEAKKEEIKLEIQRPLETKHDDIHEPVKKSDDSKYDLTALNYLRAEIAALRHELETNIIQKPAALPSSPEKKLEVERVADPKTHDSDSSDEEKRAVFKDTEDVCKSAAGVGLVEKLREEISRLREELEVNSMGKETLVVKSEAPGHEELKSTCEKLEAENTQLMLKLEKFRQEFLLSGKWKEESNLKLELTGGQLKNLRAEVAWLRQELEEGALKYGERLAMPKTPIADAESVELQRKCDKMKEDKEKIARELDEFKSYMMTLELQRKPTVQSFGNVNDIRCEVAALRSELETRALEFGEISGKNVTYRKELEDTRAKLAQKESDIEKYKLQLTDSQTLMTAKILEMKNSAQEKENVHKVEMKALNDELQNCRGALERERKQWNESVTDYENRLTRAEADCEASGNELIKLRLTVKALEADKNREINRLKGENDYISNEMKSLRLELEESKNKREVVTPEDVKLVQSAPPKNSDDSTDNEFEFIKNGSDSEVERTWKKVERKRSSTGGNTSSSDSDTARDSTDGMVGSKKKTKKSPASGESAGLSTEALLALNAQLKERITELEKEIRALRMTVQEQSVYLSQYGEYNSGKGIVIRRLTSERQQKSEAEALEQPDAKELEELKAESARLRQRLIDMERNLKRENENLTEDLRSDLKKLVEDNNEMSETIAELKLSNQKCKEEIREKERKLAELYEQLAESGKISVERQNLARELEEARRKLLETEMKLALAEKILSDDSPTGSEKEIKVQEVENLKSSRPVGGEMEDKERLIKQLEALQEENDLLKGKIEYLQEQLEKKENLIDNMMEPLVSPIDTPSKGFEPQSVKELNEAIERLEKDVKQLEADKKKLLEDLEASNEGNQDEVEKLCSDNDKLKNKIREMQAEQDDWLDEREENKNKLSAVQTELSNLEAARARAEEANRALGDENLRLKNDIEYLEKLNVVYEKQAEKLDNSETILATKEKELEALRDRLKAMENVAGDRERVVEDRDRLMRELTNMKLLLEREREDKDRAFSDHELVQDLKKKNEDQSAELQELSLVLQNAEELHLKQEVDLKEQVNLNEEFRNRIKELEEAALKQEDLVKDANSNKQLISEKDRQIEKLSNERDLLLVEIDALRKEIERRAHDLHIAEEEMKAAENDFGEEIGRLRDSLRKMELEKASTEKSLQNEIALSADALKKMELEKASTEKNLQEEIVRYVESLKKMEMEKSTVVESLQEEKIRSEKTLGSEVEELSKTKNENQDLKDKLTSNERNLLEIQVKFENIVRLLESEKQQSTDLSRQKQDLNESFESRLREKDQELERRLREKDQELQQSASILEKKIENLTREKTALEKRVKELEDELRSLKEGDSVDWKSRPENVGRESSESSLGEKENVAKLHSQIRILQESNRTLSTDVVTLEHQLSLLRLDSGSLGTGVPVQISEVDQDYFNRKIKQFVRAQSNSAEILKEKEELLSRQKRKLQRLIDENKRLNDDLDSLRDIVRIQRSSSERPGGDLQVKIRQSNQTLERLMDILAEVDKRQKELRRRSSLVGGITSLDSSFSGSLTLQSPPMMQSPTNERADGEDLAGIFADVVREQQQRQQQQQQQMGQQLGEQQQQQQQQQQDTRTESWQQMKSAVDECNIEITRLHLRNKELERHYNEIIRTYRTHLLSAMQGGLDPEVRDHLIRIIQLRPHPLTSTRLSRSLDLSGPNLTTRRPSYSLDLNTDHTTSA